MPTQLFQDDAIELMGLLSGEYVTTLAGGRIVVICTHLDGSAACAMARHSGVLYVFVDLSKPDAMRHARAMVRSEVGDVCDYADEKKVNSLVRA